MNDDEGTPLTLSREDLYELAWSKPMRETGGGMSNEVTVIPEAARDANLTPTQRFEAIVRAQEGMAEYQAPRETGELTTRAGRKVSRQVIEHAQYLERSRDKNGIVTAEAYVSGGLPFTFGYDVPGRRYRRSGRTAHNA